MIWRSGTAVSLYRGVTYEVPSVNLNKRLFKRNEDASSVSGAELINKRNSISSNSSPAATDSTVPPNDAHAPLANMETTAEEKEIELVSEVRYEDEIDKLLDALGPRYTDWPGSEPLPVDADLLPGMVPGYQPPFRVLPYGVRSTLSRKEATNLLRLARVLPPHFAIGMHAMFLG